MTKTTFLVLIILSFLSSQVYAREGSKKPRWEDILPEIGKEFLPEHTREKLDRVFPSPEQSAGKESTQKGKVKTYHGDTELSGQLSTEIKISGNGKLKHIETSKPIIITGEGVIKNSHLNHLTVNKELKAKETTFQSLKVHGFAQLKECEVMQRSVIDDDLTAEKCTFRGPLQISGKYAHFKSSTTSDIKFLSTSGKPTLILEGSEIKGNIIFEGNPGKVNIKKNSKIHGKIKNGSIQVKGDS